MHQGQANLAILDVHTDDTHLDLQTSLHHIFRARRTVLGNFRDVQEPFEVIIKLDESTEGGDFGNKAGEQIAHVVIVGNLFQPGVGQELLAPKGDALLLFVDGKNNALQSVALLDQLGGMRDLLGPAHVGNVQEAIDALFDLHERAVGGQVAHATFDHRTHRVVIVDHVPRVAVRLLHTERDFHLLIVDFQDDNFDLFAHRDQLAGVVDALGPGHLGDVHQTFDALLELDECAIGHHVDHSALEGLALRVAPFDSIPRGGGLLLDAQRDTLALEIDLEHHDFHFLVHLDHLARVVDPAPGHISDVKQAVDATEVHEHAELGDVLDHTGTHLAFLNVEQEVLPQLGTLVFHQLASGDNNVHALHVDLDDDGPHGLVDQIVHLDGTTQGHLAGGQEDVDALHIHEQTALDLALDNTLNDVSFAVLLADLFPCAQTICAALGNDRHVVGVLAFEVDIEDLTQLGAVFAEFIEGDLPFGLAADVHQDHAGTLVDRIDLRAHDLARYGVGDLFAKGCVEFFSCEAGERGVEATLEIIRIQFVLPDAAGNNCHLKLSWTQGWCLEIGECEHATPPLFRGDGNARPPARHSLLACCPTEDRRRAQAGADDPGSGDLA